MDLQDTTSTQGKQVTVEVPEDRLAEFYAFFGRFLAAGWGERRGGHGRGGGGHSPRHGGHRCGGHPAGTGQTSTTSTEPTPGTGPAA